MELHFQTDFSLFLNSQDPRKILWTEVQPDVVIFPQLWMSDFFSYDAWKTTIAQIAEAKPSIIISGFPRVSTIIRDPYVLEDVLKLTADLMYKRGQISSPEEIGSSTMGLSIWETVLGGLLYYYGYIKKAIRAYVDDLMVPYNLYGAAIEDYQGRSEYLAPFDPYFLLTVHEDLLPYA